MDRGRTVLGLCWHAGPTSSLLIGLRFSSRQVCGSRPVTPCRYRLHSPGGRLSRRTTGRRPSRSQHSNPYRRRSGSHEFGRRHSSLAAWPDHSYHPARMRLGHRSRAKHLRRSLTARLHTPDCQIEPWRSHRIGVCTGCRAVASSGAAVAPPPGDDALMPIHNTTSKTPPNITMRVLARECVRANMRKCFMAPLGIGIAARNLDSSGSARLPRRCLSPFDMHDAEGREWKRSFELRLSTRRQRMKMWALIVMALRRYGILRSLQNDRRTLTP